MAGRAGAGGAGHGGAGAGAAGGLKGSRGSVEAPLPRPGAVASLRAGGAAANAERSGRGALDGMTVGFLPSKNVRAVLSHC